jgi:5-hydroxyisourate hydrolase-like protein (transthyretin family)
MLIGMLIEDFLEEFKVLYPERSLTPKMHYLVHIPTWMNRYMYSTYLGSMILWVN